MELHQIERGNGLQNAAKLVKAFSGPERVAHARQQAAQKLFGSAAAAAPATVDIASNYRVSEVLVPNADRNSLRAVDEAPLTVADDEFAAASPELARQQIQQAQRMAKAYYMLQ